MAIAMPHFSERLALALAMPEVWLPAVPAKKHKHEDQDKHGGDLQKVVEQERDEAAADTGERKFYCDELGGADAKLVAKGCVGIFERSGLHGHLEFTLLPVAQ